MIAFSLNKLIFIIIKTNLTLNLFYFTLNIKNKTIININIILIFKIRFNTISFSILNIYIMNPIIRGNYTLF